VLAPHIKSVGLPPHEIIQFPLSCQRPPRTRGTIGLQDPLLSAAGSTLGGRAISWTSGWRSINGTSDWNNRTSQPQLHTIPQCHHHPWHKSRYMDHIAREAIEIVSVNHRTLLMPPSNFRDVTQVHLAKRSPILNTSSAYCKQTLLWMYGISLCILAI
jgi:hypothetical protein